MRRGIGAWYEAREGLQLFGVGSLVRGVYVGKGLSKMWMNVGWRGTWGRASW